MKFERLLIAVILIIGAILRFYNLESFSLTNDELSIIIDVWQCNSFGEAISNVKNTVNTAFLPLLVYSIGHCFGWSVISVRIIFVLFSILSILFSYLIGKKWFNPNVGIAVAGLVACLEFSILNSQIVRPYSPGLLFYLAYVYYWSQYLFFDNKKSNLLVIGIAFLGALAASTHYFCALSVGITGIVGLFFLNRFNWKNYLKFIVLGVILFSPNVPILLKQMGSSATLGWLGYASPYFILHHIYTIFNNSILLLLFCLAPIIIYIIHFRVKKFNRLQFISIALFILPYFALTIYELTIQPTLVSRYLYFSFPFLLIFLLSFIQKSGKLAKIITFSIVSFSLISSTLINKTYSTFHYGEFKRIAEKHALWERDYGKEHLSAASLIISEDYINFYFEKLHLKPPSSIVYIDRTKKQQELAEYVNLSAADYFVFSWSNTQTPLELYEIILQKYPHIEQQKIYYNSAITLFSKDAQNTSTSFSSNLNYVNPNTTFWNLKKENIVISDSMLLEKMNADILYSSTFETSVEKLTFDKNDNYIVASIDYKSDSNINPLLVLTITRGDENIIWRSANFSDYNSNDEYSTVFICTKIPSNAKPTDIIKAFVWNNSKDSLQFNNFSIKIKKQSEIPSSSYFF
ncbi:MAG: glycosyltransferase family 39 protein [Flavobacteriales bacterium]|nr:glycosyltransferase family 39 protein [Flavobacteriales bacterium]